MRRGEYGVWNGIGELRTVDIHLETVKVSNTTLHIEDAKGAWTGG